MSIEFGCVGPIPLPLIQEAVQQSEAQGWEVRFVCFAGMIAPKISLAVQAAGVPAFICIMCKEFLEGSKIEGPKFTFMK